MNLINKHLVSGAALFGLLSASVACTATGPSGPQGGGMPSGGGGGNTGGGGGGGTGGGGGGGGGSGSGTGGPVQPPDMNEDYLFPEVAQTGFDGTHVFKVPLSTNLSNVTWKVEDPTIATIVPAATPAEWAEFGEAWAMVTTKKAGTTKITATGGGKTVTSTLVVKAYTAANVNAGDKRYNTPDNATTAQRVSCASCHKSANGADHSPVVLAGLEDDNILAAIKTGTYGDGYKLMVAHAWNLTAAEEQGILPYLRTLPPRGF